MPMKPGCGGSLLQIQCPVPVLATWQAPRHLQFPHGRDAPDHMNQGFALEQIPRACREGLPAGFLAGPIDPDIRQNRRLHG